jgi:hypothetical protein
MLGIQMVMDLAPCISTANPLLPDSRIQYNLRKIPTETDFTPANSLLPDNKPRDINYFWSILPN